MAETYLLAMRCPVFRRRDSHSGFRTELETLVDDVKGKDASGDPVRSKVPMHRSGSDCPYGQKIETAEGRAVWRRVLRVCRGACGRTTASPANLPDAIAQCNVPDAPWQCFCLLYT